VLSWRNARFIRGLLSVVGGVRQVSYVTRCGRCGYDNVTVPVEAGKALCNHIVIEKKMEVV
jgi:hypothetical protein